MTTVDTLTELIDWLQSRVCPLITLKLPEDYNELGYQVPQDKDYPYEVTHPTVMGMYMPTSAELLPPGVKDVHPGILVQVVAGSESFTDTERKLTVRLNLSVWNPGRHGSDVWYPLPAGEEHQFERTDAHDFRAGYDDGWRDAWNFMDTVIRELRNAPTFAGASIDKDEGFTFGPYEANGEIPDLYPYWFCWVELHLKGSVPSPVSDRVYADFL